MPKIHPHAEATYRVFAAEDGSFAVEVTIPDTYPTRVSPFAHQRDAEDWIADHKRRVEAQSQTRGSWHRSGRPASVDRQRTPRPTPADPASPGE